LQSLNRCLKSLNLGLLMCSILLLLGHKGLHSLGHGGLLISRCIMHLGILLCHSV
jgi:hypothetical protein